MNIVQELTMAWEQRAIEKCRADPVLAKAEQEGGYCITCMMDRPCLCDDDRVKREMRDYYEANRRNWCRREPKLTGSWGVDQDGLMTGLLEIASKPYESELKRLRKRVWELKKTIEVQSSDSA